MTAPSTAYEQGVKDGYQLAIQRLREMAEHAGEPIPILRASDLLAATSPSNADSGSAVQS